LELAGFDAHLSLSGFSAHECLDVSGERRCVLEQEGVAGIGKEQQLRAGHAAG
jgi:hypothetical protein